MSESQKLDIETFYKNLQKKFPALQNLSVWNEWGWSNEGVEHSVVMSILAREMINWGEKGDLHNVIRILNEVEEGFMKGSLKLTAYLGTDFTVTITDCKNVELREQIKKLMGPLTSNCYQMNLGGYREV